MKPKMYMVTGPTLKITSMEKSKSTRTGPTLKITSMNFFTSMEKSSKCFSVSKMFPTFWYLNFFPYLRFLGEDQLKKTLYLKSFGKTKKNTIFFMPPLISMVVQITEITWPPGMGWIDVHVGPGVSIISKHSVFL